jgi:hypothetical protein
MSWSLFSGHSCEPEDVVRGQCPDCETTWTRRDKPHTIAEGLSGQDMRDDNGRSYPLF